MIGREGRTGWAVTKFIRPEVSHNQDAQTGRQTGSSRHQTFIFAKASELLVNHLSSSAVAHRKIKRFKRQTDDDRG